MTTRTYNGVTLAVTKRQGWTLDTRTAEYFDAVNKAMPGGVIIVQGSYNRSVSASAGTHDGPGALDLKPASLYRRNVTGYKQLEKICRELGGAAWFRQWTNNYHVHVILIGTRGLNSVARNQVSAYLNGRDGLVSNNRVTGIINTTFEKWKNLLSGIGAATSNSVRTKLLQKALRQGQDGVWGPQTELVLQRTRSTAREKYTGAYFKGQTLAVRKAMQATWGAYQDGIWGPATKSWATKSVVDIQRALGVTADGVWGPQTDTAFMSFRAKVYKPAAPAAPGPYDNIGVDLKTVIYKSRLLAGKPVTVDVKRYQAALWNKLSSADRQAWSKKWGIKREQVADGAYGKATEDLTRMVYTRWGQTPNATEPGFGMLKYLGFTAAK